MNPSTPTSNDRYSLQHLSYHLFQAGLNDELYALVVGKEWYRQSTDFDPSGQQYSEDIRRAFQATVEQIEPKMDASHTSTLSLLLARPAALAWLLASFGQAAKLISTPLLVAMTQLGEGEQALRRAEMIPDPVRRAEVLARIGETLFALGHQAEARMSWIQAKDRLLEAPTDIFNEKLEAMGQLAQTLARNGQIEEAASLATRLQLEVEAEIEQAGGVVSSAYIALAGAWGAVGERGRALTTVYSLTGVQSQLRALCAAAAGLSYVDQSQALATLDVASELVSQTNVKVNLSQLALHLAEAGQLSSAWKLVGDANAAHTRSRVLSAAARGAYRRSEMATGEALLAEAVQAAMTAEPEKDRLLLLAELAATTRQIADGKFPAELLGLIKERWQEFESEFDTNALGTVAQGLLALGDASAAQAVVSTALDWQLPADDWEENDALGELARTLGKTGDSNGLAWILARARGRQTAWQQAELAYHVTGAAEETGDIVLAGEARQLMEAAALGKTGSLAGANAYGILAVWQVERQNVTTARELIAQVVEELKEDPDGADALAYLALTLAYGQAPDLAGFVLQQAIGVLQEEFDPNTLARATGTAAEAAAALGDMETFDLLKTIAREIDDDWLQAEALFWIAGWQAVLGRYDEARQIYLAAAVSGLWQENSDSQVEAAWNEDNVDWILNIAQSVGWPSTNAAAIFAGLALSLSKPEPDWFDDGLLAIDQITEGYNHIRAVCHRLLLESVTKFSDQPAAIVNYWVLALAHNRGRNAGEVWAIMKAGIPVLYAQFGQLFVKSLWHELATVRNLFS